MAKLSAIEFLDKIASDAGFRAQFGFTSIMKLEEFQAKAAAAGYNYSTEEILAAAESQQNEALSDDTLDNVSGGTLTGSFIIHIIL